MSVKPQFPKEYSSEEYARWHDSQFADDVPFAVNLTAKLDALRKKSAVCLEDVGQLLFQLKTRTESECRISTEGLLHGAIVVPKFDVGGSDSSARRDETFKSAESVTNKMWRLNRERRGEDRVCLANLSVHIHDLVRTSVVTPSLFQAREYATRLRRWEDVIPSEERGKYIPLVRKVTVDEEAKLASGYFAYHGSVTFDEIGCVEVQIFSQLMATWREISHVLYDKIRVGGTVAKGIVAPATRFVSLGHALHLADCELARLADELKGKG